MSESPTVTPDSAWIADESSSYSKRWQDLNSLVESGRSWSGNERNCCFLNLGNGGFANVSAVSGFDFSGDGRGLALTDWDRDGNLDIWITNRTAPRVQFLRNNSPTTGRFASMILIGNGESTNRDAIGARVELVLKNRSDASPRMARTLRAGEGFLSQGSKSLHFGLGERDSLERVIVRWPGGGVEEFNEIEAGNTYQLVQGSGSGTKLDAPTPELAKLPAPRGGALSAEGTSRLVPEYRLAVPPIAFESLEDKNKRLTLPQGKPVLLNLWASWCVPCLAELREFTEQADSIRAAGVEVVALSVDEDSDAAIKALSDLDFPFHTGHSEKPLVELLHLIYHQLYAKPQDLPVPTSFLIDGKQRLAVIYRGKVSAETLVADVKALASGKELSPDDSGQLGGQWAVEPSPIPLGDFAFELFSNNFPDEGIALVMDHKDSFSKRSPGYIRMIGKTATELLKRGDHAEAAGLFQEVIQLAPDDLMSLNNLAWILATSSDPAARNGASAVLHAERAATLTNFKSPHVLETLAAAYAEAGQFAEARATARRGLALAQAAKIAELVASLNRASSSYKANRPLRTH